jgi:hypothetical protein
MAKPSPEALFCAALYTLTGGKLKRLMVTTMAEQLGITFERAEALADACAERGWLAHEVHTVSLRQDASRWRSGSSRRHQWWPRPARRRRRAAVGASNH